MEILLNILLRGKEPIYNVGGFSKTTIGELAKDIGKYAEVPVTFPQDSEGGIQGAPDDVFLDMSRATNEFSKKEFISLEEGLKKTITWQRALYDSK